MVVGAAEPHEGSGGAEDGGGYGLVESDRMCGQAGKWWGCRASEKGQRKAALVVVLAAWRCGSALR